MKRFLLGLVVGFVLGVAAVVGTLAGVGHYLAVSDELTKADAIVAISGDTGARLDTAVALWKAGYAPVLIFSGAALDPLSVSSAELMRRDAIAAGVPGDAILVEGSSATTEENAERVAALMTLRGFRSAILVTSPYHQRRAAILFARAFSPAGLRFMNHPASDPDWDPNRWWTHEPSRTLTIRELTKLGATIAGRA